MTAYQDAPISPTAAAAAAKLTKREQAALRAAWRREWAAERKPGRSRPPVETPALAAAAGRMVRSVGDRAATDLTALPLLADLSRQVDAALHRAVTGARDPQTNPVPYSWTDVGRALGVSRSAAQQRFGR